MIICPQDEIIKRTLSIYKMSEEAPLPGNDEVIYCNANTTNEQLELFWKRCMFAPANGEKKIYSLINVQDLLYDQAVKAQVCFEKLLAYSGDKINKQYVLCIICSAEKEDKSVFATAFSRYKKNVPLEKNIEIELNKYLSNHFRFVETQEDGPSMKEIEKDGLNVRVVTSERSAVGKSLYIKRLVESAQQDVDNKIQCHCISVKKQTLPFESIFKSLQKYDMNTPKIIHIDIAYEVWYEVDYFLFNLLCLGVVQNLNGEIFRRSGQDLYLIEIMSPKFQFKNDESDADKSNFKPLHSILTILPSLSCLTPVETFNIIQNMTALPDNVCPMLFDMKTLNSALIQRSCQYLNAVELNQDLDSLKYSTKSVKIKAQDCLRLLLKHLEHNSPSWSEIIHFASFLNTQLVDCENSIFCDIGLTGDLLPGFKKFVIKFMIQMSHDFALPSLYISDRSALNMKANNQAEFQIEQLKMRRKWENDPHPYLFFNPDGQTFTFFGFYVDRNSGALLEPNTNKRLFDNLLIDKRLMQGIELQDRNLLSENIANMSKQEKIFKLLRVMGVKWADDITKVRDPGKNIFDSFLK